MPITNQDALTAMRAVENYLEMTDGSKNGVLPLDPDLADGCPGVDPTGMYTVMEMKFQKRRDLIDRCAGGKWPEARWYVNGILQTENARRLQESVRELSKELRLVKLAEGVCQNEEGRGELAQRRLALQNHPDVKAYHTLLRGAEVALGLDRNKLSLDERRALLENGTPYSDQMEQLGKVRNQPLTGEVSVHFPDQQKILQEGSRRLEYSPGMGLLANREAVNQETTERRTEDYAAACAWQALAPFEALPGGIPLEERVVIGGRTGKELLDEARIGEGLQGDALQEMRRRELCKRVSGAMMDQPPMAVDLFQELEPGKLSPEPLHVAKTGYQPREPYYMNLWQRLCHFLFGAYKEEAAREQETREQAAARERQAAARERVLLSHKGRAAAQSTPSKQLRLAGNDAYQKIVDAQELAQARYEGLLSIAFPNGDPAAPYPDNPNEKIYAGRDAPPSMLMGILAADGHSIEDILDPGKLVEEKRQAGEELRQHVRDNDLGWYAEKLYKGCQKLSEIMEEKLKGTDLTDDNALVEAHPVLHSLAHGVACLSQEMDRAGIAEELARQLGKEKAKALTEEVTNLGLQGCMAADELLGAKRDLYEHTLGLRRGGTRAHVTGALRRLMLSDSARYKMTHLLSRGEPLKDIRLTSPSIMAYEISMDPKVKAILDPLEADTPEAEQARCRMANIALKGDYQAMGMEFPIRVRFGSDDPTTLYQAELRTVRRNETPEEYRYRRRMSEEIQEIKDALEGSEYAVTALDKALFGGKMPKSVNTSVRMDRTMPRHFCISQLLRKGCPMEDIMDPNKLKDEKREVGAEFAKHVEAGNVAWVADEMYEGLKAASEELTRRMKLEGGQGLTNDRNLLGKTASLYTLGRLCFDLGQEVQVRSDQEGGGIREHLDGKLPKGELQQTVSRADGLTCVTDGLYHRLRAKAALFNVAMGIDGRGEDGLKDSLETYLLGGYIKEQTGAGLARGEEPDRLIDHRALYVVKNFVGADPVVSTIGQGITHKDPQARQAARTAVVKAMMEGTLPRMTQLRFDMEAGDVGVEITRDTPLERQMAKLSREGDERARAEVQRTQAQPARQAPKKAGPQKSK